MKKWLKENPHPFLHRKLDEYHISLLRETRTKRMKEWWKDPNSVFNSKEYREKLKRNSSKFLQHHIVPRELGGKKVIKIDRKNHGFVENHIYRKVLYDLVRDYVPEKTIKRTFETVFYKWYNSHQV
jgi:hypothetical protein